MVPSTIEEKKTAVITDQGNELTEAVVPGDQPGNTDCNNCSGLKSSMTVLQESILSLKEEMLQLRAVSDLIISSPSASDKKLEVFVRNKLRPIEEKVSQLRGDLDTLRAVVEEQNDTLDKVVNLKTHISEELKAELTDRLKTTKTDTKTRLETLEMGQENLTKAIKNVSKSATTQAQSATRELKGELGDTIGSIEATSHSNRTRIEALEVCQENLIQAAHGSSQSQLDHDRAKHEKPPKSEGRAQSKGTAPAHSPTDTNGATRSWANVVEDGGEKPFTMVNKNNEKNHRERSISDAPGIKNNQQSEKKAIPPGIKNPSQPVNNRNRSHKTSTSRYRKHTVLLIHDKNFQHFNAQSFSSQFNVHQFGLESFRDLEKDRKELNETVKKLRPQGIYIHLGINDLLKTKATVSDLVHDLADHLLKSTDARVCFSLLIPSSTDTQLNDRIQLVNDEIKSNVSWFHKADEKLRSRVFTFSNHKVGNQNTYSPNSGFELTTRGEKMLYIRLREGLKKTLRLPRTSYHTDSTKRRSTNRFSDE